MVTHESPKPAKPAKPAEPTSQPDPEASSDGDGSWTDDPITQDPDQDRSVDAVIGQTNDYGDGDATDEG